MPEERFHVASWGRDSWPGNLDRPFATLAAAQRAVRARTAGMRGDLVVDLHAGTYRLTEALRLDAAEGDSGEGGYRVIYQAHGYGTPAAERVVLSGGRPVTGWRVGPDGTWSAEVGDLVPRQLYVDGRRAARAAVSPGIPGSVTKTDTGFVTDSTLPQSWHDPAGIEFVFAGVNPWSEARIGVAAITGDARSTTITMAQPAFGRATELYAVRVGDDAPPGWTPDWGTLGAPTSAEGSVSFLTEAGTFALDRSVPGRHVLRYLPRPGENPATSEAIVPVLDRLVVGLGSPQRPLHDVTLRGLTFSHAGWDGPSGPGGFLHYHGDAYHDGGPLRLVELAPGIASTMVPAAPAQVPAHVEFHHATRITLRDNTFSALGAGAVRLSAVGGGCAITGNVIEDVSAGGVSIQDGRDVRVEENLIHHVGREYHGCPAVAVADSRDVTVAGNDIHHVPYSGIIVMGGERTGGVEVAHNHIHHTMTVLADGGGIYLAGPQGTSWASGAVVRGNVVHDTVNRPSVGIYTDFGAAWVTVAGNAVYRGDAPIMLRPSPPLAQVAFLGNFWDDGRTAPAQPATTAATVDLPEGVAFYGNTVLRADGHPCDAAATGHPDRGFEAALAADPAGADILAAAGRRAPSQPR